MGVRPPGEVPSGPSPMQPQQPDLAQLRDQLKVSLKDFTDSIVTLQKAPHHADNAQSLEHFAHVILSLSELSKQAIGLD